MTNKVTAARRATLVAIVTALWGLVTFVLRRKLEMVLTSFSYLVVLGIRTLGIPSINDGPAVFLERTSRVVDLGDTGVFWWGAILAVWLSSGLTWKVRGFKTLASLLICTAIHVSYYASIVIVQTAHMGKVEVLLSGAWYATLFLLAAYLVSDVTKESRLQGANPERQESHNSPATAS